jgi:hypothetical protein
MAKISAFLTDLLHLDAASSHEPRLFRLTAPVLLAMHDARMSQSVQRMFGICQKNAIKH